MTSTDRSNPVRLILAFLMLGALGGCDFPSNAEKFSQRDSAPARVQKDKQDKCRVFVHLYGDSSVLDIQFTARIEDCKANGASS